MAVYIIQTSIIDANYTHYTHVFYCMYNASVLPHSRDYTQEMCVKATEINMTESEQNRQKYKADLTRQNKTTTSDLV